MNRKLWKKEGRQSFLKNYWRCFAVCIIVTLLAGGSILFIQNHSQSIELSHFPLHQIDGKTNAEIVNEFLRGVSLGPVPTQNGVIGNVLNHVSRSGSFLFGILNAMNQFFFHDRIIAGFIIIIGVFVSVLYWAFIAKVLEVGRCRFFLENRIYCKTRIGRVLLGFRVRKNLRIAWTLLLKNFYQFLWMFTIIGGPIKYYSYRMLPYILAENPTISGNQAIRLSEDMMEGHKWEAFLMDLSFLGWDILGICTINLSNLFYTNAYKESTFAFYYMHLRESCFAKIQNAGQYFVDTYLENNPDRLTEYPEQKYFLKEHESRKFLRSINYQCHYDVTDYILIFFAVSIFGWLWEVGITLFSEGVFVNRGTFFGPWLPIYGSGGVLILFLLQKIRNHPLRLFFLTVLVCGVIEYGTAIYLEVVHHLKWWDYTGYFLNIQGRICLEGLLVFGIGGILLTYVIGPYLYQIFHKMNEKVKLFLAIFLVMIFAVDIFYSHQHPNIGDRITTELHCITVLKEGTN